MTEDEIVELEQAGDKLCDLLRRAGYPTAAEKIEQLISEVLADEEEEGDS